VSDQEAKGLVPIDLLLNCFPKVSIVEVLDFLMAVSHICANDEYQSQVGATNRPENIVIRYVSFVSLSCVYLNLKVVGVISFHLHQIFHWFIAPPSRRYFQGRSP
jgi:hypothetical protein